MIADLAVVFHWRPADCEDMDIDELMDWHEKARKRSETDK
ncbi:P2 GpE family protein [Psychrobacter sp. G]|nr:GpE family phage tail protein [Psychrobacter sp. G]AGP47608.1 P2 GpE family protein [Psychrobacter sp. G]